jgi:hypothetical protein
MTCFDYPPKTPLTLYPEVFILAPRWRRPLVLLHIDAPIHSLQDGFIAHNTVHMAASFN